MVWQCNERSWRHLFKFSHDPDHTQASLKHRKKAVNNTKNDDYQKMELTVERLDFIVKK